MTGFENKQGLALAAKELEREFGLRLENIPDRRPVDDLFFKMSAQGQLSHESQVALLYRLVAMNYLAVCKLMRDGGQDTPPENLLWLTNLLDRSIDWSESAHDQVTLEQVTSQLNMNIQSFMSSFGIYHGKEGLESHTDSAQPEFEPTTESSRRTSDEIMREVQRCARVAAQEKTKFRLEKLNGFFDKLKNESKLRQWGIDLERRYTTQIAKLPQLWNIREPSEHRTIAFLWKNFGLGDAHSDEAIYSDNLALDVLMTWIVSLYPQVSISSSDLADQLRRLQIRNTQALEGAYARGHRVVMPLPVDQLVRELSQELGPYG